MSNKPTKEEFNNILILAKLGLTNQVSKVEIDSLEATRNILVSGLNSIVKLEEWREGKDP